MIFYSPSQKGTDNDNQWKLLAAAANRAKEQLRLTIEATTIANDAVDSPEASSIANWIIQYAYIIKRKKVFFVAEWSHQRRHRLVVEILRFRWWIGEGAQLFGERLQQVTGDQYATGGVR